MKALVLERESCDGINFKVSCNGMEWQCMNGMDGKVGALD